MIQTVSNTGPILHLWEVGALPLLSHFGEIHVPPRVEIEVAHYIQEWFSIRPLWLRTTKLDSAFGKRADDWIRGRIVDPGEAEAIALALQSNCKMFLTDDATARLLAGTLGLEVHGSLGIVLASAAKGHLDRAAAEAVLTSLAASSLWISSRILEEARAALKELFA